jgi:hypothetical protein
MRKASHKLPVLVIIPRDVAFEESHVGEIGAMSLASGLVRFNSTGHLEAGKPHAFTKAAGAAEERNRLKHPGSPLANPVMLPCGCSAGQNLVHRAPRFVARHTFSLRLPTEPTLADQPLPYFLRRLR